MRRVVLAALLGLVPSAARAATYAINIGVNAPPEGTPDGPLPLLRYADDDAVRLHALLGRVGVHAFLFSVLDDATQRRYPEAAAAAREPKLSAIREVIDELRRRMVDDRERGEEVVLLLSYSGHGARASSGEVFLALADAGITEAILYDELLANLPATYVHVMIDACNATSVVGVRGAFEVETSAKIVPVDGEALASRQRLETFPTVGVLVATTSGQEAHEWSRIESGVFTHELISALTGAADINLDGRIEYSEVDAFVAAANRDLRDPRAVPRLVALPPRLNRHAAIVTLKGTPRTGVLEGRPGALGHFHIELENGERYMDAHPDQQMTARILLPASRLAFVRTAGNEARLRVESDRPTTFGELRFAPREEAARGSVDATYHRDLFASPYGLDYYRGFADQNGGVSVALSRVDLHPDATRAHRRAGWLFALSGVFVAAAGTSTYLAIDAHHDYNATDLQRASESASNRYRVATAGLALSSALAVTSAVVGWILWNGDDVAF